MFYIFFHKVEQNGGIQMKMLIKKKKKMKKRKKEKVKHKNFHLNKDLNF